MKIRKKNLGYLGALIILFSLVIIHIHREQSKEVVLQFGMFAGSQWNVPNDDYYKIIDETIEEFEKENPNVKVKYTSGILKNDYSEWISEQALRGEIPDVMMVFEEDMPTFSATGLLLKLDGLIKSDSVFHPDAFYENIYQAGEYEESQYALPYESVPTMMFVNQTLLKKEGIKMPESNWTWEEFYRICKKVTKDTDGDGSIDQFGVYDYNWDNSIVTNGCQLFNEKGTECNLTNPSVKDAIEFTKKIYDISGSQQPTSKEFDQGKVAFRPMTFAEYKTYKPYPWRLKKYSNFEWDCKNLPSGPNGVNATDVNNLLMGISKTTKYKKEAWAFLKMLTYNQKTQGKILVDAQGLSALKSVNQSAATKKILQEEVSLDGSVKLEFLDDIMERAYLKPKFKRYHSIVGDMDKGILYLLIMNEDIDDGLLKLKQEIERKLK